MRIAVITSTYPCHPGDGRGSFVHSMMSSLVQLGHQVSVLAPYDEAAVADWPTDVNVKRVRYVWPNKWSVLGYANSLDSDTRLRWHAYPLVLLFGLVAFFRLWSEVRRRTGHAGEAESPVIYAQWLLPGGLIGALVSRLTGVPLVISLHGSDVFVAEKYRVFRPAVRFALSTACHVIACSADLARRCIGLGMVEERVTVVPYGVDVERYAPSSEAALSSRERWAIPESSPIVMAMGRLVYKKGFSTLLRAAPQILAQYPNTYFVVAGEGDLRAELEELAESQGVREQVLFAGHIPWDQTPAVLASADVCVVPSVQDEAGNVDGLPNVLLEAMATGGAIVASRVAGIPEVIQHSRSGLLVVQKDVQALVEAICALLSDVDLRSRLGSAARDKIVSGLTWRHAGERVVAILQDCVGQGGGG